MRQRGLWWVFAVVAALAIAAPASASNEHGAKVDDRVALAADDSVDPSTQIPVIVFGNRYAAADPRLHVKQNLYLATAGTVAAADLDALAADPNVAYVAPDVAMAPLAKPTPSSGNGKPGAVAYPKLTSLFPSVDGAPAAWNRGYTGAGVGIAIIDSGVSGGVGGRLVVRTGANQGNDKYGHGTVVASVAAGDSSGQYLGVAPQANVIDVNVANDGGTYTSDVVSALIWVLMHRTDYNIRVVNLSLAETTPSSYTDNLLDTMVEICWQYGVLVVTSAGNSGPDTAQFAPANDPYALAVGATDANGTVDPSDDTIAPWSTSGITLDGIQKPDLVAPGRLVEGFLSEDSPLGLEAPAQNWIADDIVRISGTSFSAPQVAGAAAILFQAHPDWSAAQVRNVLQTYARPQAGSPAPALDLSLAINAHGNPQPYASSYPFSEFGLPSWVNGMLSTTGSTWSHSSWNHSSWNANSWNANDWTHSGWNTNDWDHSGWNHSSWNDEGWR